MAKINSQKTAAEAEAFVAEALNGGLPTAEVLQRLISTHAQVATAATPQESVDVDPRLTTYNVDYKKWPKAQQKQCPWQEVQSRLLANDAHYLHLADAMSEGKGSVLFGIDAQGRPLVADKGVEPIMKGLDYPTTRNAVMFTENKKGKKTPTGYTMFPHAGNHKSPEILAYESHTQEPFVASANKQEWRSAWLESGENPSHPRRAGFDPDVGYVSVYNDSQNLSSPVRGVRRLLRLEKA